MSKVSYSIRQYLRKNSMYLKHTNIAEAAGIRKNNMTLFMNERYVLSETEENALLQIIKSFQLTKK